MQLGLLIGLLVLVGGAEYAMKFTASTKSQVWIGDVLPSPRPSPCRVCAFNSTLCYTDILSSYQPMNNFSALELPIDQITLETWVRFDELNSTTNLIGVTDGVDELRNYPQGGFRLGFFRGFPTFGVSISSTTQGWPSQDLLAVSGPSALQWVIGRWYHMAGTWDGVYRKLYIDGELMDAHKPKYIPLPLQYSAARFSLGGSTQCQIEVLFSGALAEVRMWNVARTADEIAELMSVRAVGDEVGLTGLWREVVADQVQDLSGHQPVAVARAVVPELLSNFPPPQTSPRWINGPSPCVPYPGSFCSNVINFPVFVPNNTWQWRVEGSLEGFNILQSLASPDCYNALLAHLCGLWYPRCLLRNITQTHQVDPTVNYSAPLVFEAWVPMPVSAESCTEVAEICAVEFDLMGHSGLKGAIRLAMYQMGSSDATMNNSVCLGSWLLGGNQTDRGIAFPSENATTHTYGPFVFTEPFVENTAVAVTTANPSCDYPFVLSSSFTQAAQTAFIEGFLTLTAVSPADFVNSPYCQPQCPPALMPPAQYVNYSRATGGIAVFSFLFSLITLVLIMRDPSKRKFPGILMVMMLGSVVGLSFALSLSVFGNWDQYFCLDKHNHQAVQGDNALCDTQALLLQFFLATTQCYWCSLCVYLYRALTMKPVSSWYPYTLIPLAVAFLSCIILASLGKMGLASSGNVCWVRSNEAALAWCLYYAPGLLNVLFSAFIIFSYARNRKKGGFATDAAFARMFHITVLLLIAAIFSITAQSHVSRQYPQFLLNVGTFLKCRNLALAFDLFENLHSQHSNNTQEVLDSLRQAGGFDASGDPNSCKPFESGFVVGLFYVDQLVFASLGTLVPIILVARQVRKIIGADRWTGSSQKQPASRIASSNQINLDTSVRDSRHSRQASTRDSHHSRQASTASTTSTASITELQHVTN